MDDDAVRISRHNGITPWRAGCGESRTSGWEGGPERPTDRNVGRALRSDPYTEHPTREGKVYCCCVLDTCSRRIVGWSIDSAQDTTLVVNALDMAIKQRRVKKGSIVHADHGVQFTSWSFTERIRDAGLMPSFGSVGDAFDNAMMESFWSSLQNELPDRRKCKTRLELSNAIFDYIEIFYNRQRRHSSLDHVSPIEFELSFKEEKTA